MKPTDPRDSREPTLTEYALVVLVMGTIGLVGFPRPAPGSDQEALRAAEGARVEREAMVALERLQRAVWAFHADHGRFPGTEPSSDRGAEFVRELTEQTTESGRAAVLPWDEANRFGPYLWEVPTNPWNGRSSVRVLRADEPFPRGSRNRTGWIYRPSTGEVRLDAPAELTPAPADL